MPLTDIAVRTAKAGDKSIKLSDGSGLHLLVTPTGSKLWRMVEVDQIVGDVGKEGAPLQGAGPLHSRIGP